MHGAMVECFYIVAVDTLAAKLASVPIKRFPLKMSTVEPLYQDNTEMRTSPSNQDTMHGPSYIEKCTKLHVSLN